MPIVFDVEKCEGCRTCIDVCPVGVFEADEGNGKVTLPNIDECIECGACVAACPMEALELE